MSTSIRPPDARTRGVLIIILGVVLAVVGAGLYITTLSRAIGGLSVLVSVAVGIMGTYTAIERRLPHRYIIYALVGALATLILLGIVVAIIAHGDQPTMIVPRTPPA